MTAASRVDAIRAFHTELLSAGIDAPHYHLAGWGSEESQRVRFAALLRAVDFRGGSVVDFGCGPGDLYSYLAASQYEFSYTGLDLNESLLAVARASYDAEFRLIGPDVVDFAPADYVFASGVFQFADRSDPHYYRRLIGQLYARCRVALGANFLSADRDESDKHADELYLDPAEAVLLADELSARWLIDHSYHPARGDLTLAILVDEARAEAM